MSKMHVLPGQESMPIPAGPPSLQPAFDVAAYVDRCEGLISLEELPDFEIDWDRELTYVDFMGEIGVALAAEPPRSGMWDRPMKVHEEDFRNASIRKLKPAQYFGPQDSRRRNNVVTVSNGTPTLQAPGVRGRREGVAVSSNEFHLIARSAEDLGKHVYSKTKRANEKRPDDEKLDDETLHNTAGRSVVHAMDERAETLLALDTELRIERLALKAVHELSIAAGPHKPMSEMDFYRRASTLAIVGAAKVAFEQLGYGTNRREGAIRALTSAFYRRDAEGRAAALRAYTRWAGYYIDAKRGKISQSLSATGEMRHRYKRFLATKSLEQAA